MFSVGEIFVESSEHTETEFIITEVFDDYVIAKNTLDNTERHFTKYELMKGNSFCSYWFKRL